jgi:hypothetical protein
MVRLALIFALALLVGSSAVAQAQGPDIQLAVPYRSQLDGTPYASANCGPASVGMVLAAFGIERQTHDLRLRANRLQGTWGYDDGIAIEHLATIVREHGLQTYGLWDGEAFRRWTLDDARAALRAGRPVIPQVWYRALPGRWNSRYQYDHYIVLVGTVGESFLYHDPIDYDHPGAYRVISAEQLTKAWRSSDVPWGAFAVGPEGESPLRPRPKPQPAPQEPPLTLSRVAVQPAAPAEAAAPAQPAAPAEERAAVPTETPAAAPVQPTAPAKAPAQAAATPTTPAASLVPKAPWRVMVPPEPTPSGEDATRAAPSVRGGRPNAAPEAAAGSSAEPRPVEPAGLGGPIATLATALQLIVRPIVGLLGA